MSIAWKNTDNQVAGICSVGVLGFYGGRLDPKLEEHSLKLKKSFPMTRTFNLLLWKTVSSVIPISVGCLSPRSSFQILGLVPCVFTNQESFTRDSILIHQYSLTTDPPTLVKRKFKPEETDKRTIFSDPLSPRTSDETITSPFVEPIPEHSIPEKVSDDHNELKEAQRAIGSTRPASHLRSTKASSSSAVKQVQEDTDSKTYTQHAERPKKRKSSAMDSKIEAPLKADPKFSKEDESLSASKGSQKKPETVPLPHAFLSRDTNDRESLLNYDKEPLEIVPFYLSDVPKRFENQRHFNQAVQIFAEIFVARSWIYLQEIHAFWVLSYIDKDKLLLLFSKELGSLILVKAIFRHLDQIFDDYRLRFLSCVNKLREETSQSDETHVEFLTLSGLARILPWEGRKRLILDIDKNFILNQNVPDFLNQLHLNSFKRVGIIGDRIYKSMELHELSPLQALLALERWSVANWLHGVVLDQLHQERRISIVQASLREFKQNVEHLWNLIAQRTSTPPFHPAEILKHQLEIEKQKIGFTFEQRRLVFEELWPKMSLEKFFHVFGPVHTAEAQQNTKEIWEFFLDGQLGYTSGTSHYNEIRAVGEALRLDEPYYTFEGLSPRAIDNALLTLQAAIPEIDLTLGKIFKKEYNQRVQLLGIIYRRNNDLRLQELVAINYSDISSWLCRGYRIQTMIILKTLLELFDENNQINLTIGTKNALMELMHFIHFPTFDSWPNDWPASLESLELMNTLSISMETLTQRFEIIKQSFSD
ncbi:hypothetical protein O181_023813 [Austropuccinia psidii MF-1]|uniref:Uncharacterized protein n=1 Tax=Austropuccinia psidii MF-1 TaxID=1389203 RepID=A0A9Q3CHR9_9BASI|nr:hypothetical protein [Austropuccinia psidii MF-1]